MNGMTFSSIFVGQEIVYNITITNPLEYRTLKDVIVVDADQPYLTYIDSKSTDECARLFDGAQFNVECPAFPLPSIELAPGEFKTYKLVFQVDPNTPCNFKLMNQGDAFVGFDAG